MLKLLPRGQSANCMEILPKPAMKRFILWASFPRSPRCTDPASCFQDDGVLVLLRDQDACCEGRFDRVDDQLVGQDVQFLHLVPGHIDAARNAIADRETYYRGMNTEKE